MNYAETYIRSFKGKKQEVLNELYLIGVDIIPDVVIKKSYNMPAFFYHNQPVFYFANAKNHLGFYPTPSPIREFENSLKDLKLKFSKGAVQLSYDTDLPLELIKKMIRFRINEIEH